MDLPRATGAEAARVHDLARVLELAVDALEVELGGRPAVGAVGAVGRWTLQLGGVEPAHHLDRRAARLVTEAPTVDGLFEALSTLRELTGRPDGTWPVRDCASVDELVERVRANLATSWPSWGLRGLDAAALAARHAPRVRAAADPIDAVARWVAELGDAHTAVRPTAPQGRVPYPLHVAERAVFWDVPAGSPAHAAGVRPGWALQGPDLEALRARTGATAHSRPWVVGVRALSGPLGEERAFTATGPGGARATWSERLRHPFEEPPTWWRVGRGGWLRLPSIPPGTAARIDAAFAALAGCERLVVDLRGNGGGNLAEAAALRDRFLRGPTVLGTLRATRPDGALGPEATLRGAPPPHGRWSGPVRFLTDERTYSAAEDLLLGLQGLPHVEVWGRPSGGGSGRVRTVRLLPGWVSTVSTALTWDRSRRVVEGQGVLLDRRVPWPGPGPDPLDDDARSWVS